MLKQLNNFTPAISAGNTPFTSSLHQSIGGAATRPHHTACRSSPSRYVQLPKGKTHLKHGRRFKSAGAAKAMLLLSLLGLSSALDVNRHVPTIMISTRGSSLNREHPVSLLDPLFFEQLFNGGMAPMAFGDEAGDGFAPAMGRTKTVAFRSRPSLEDRVNDRVSDRANDRDSESHSHFRSHNRHRAAKAKSTRSHESFGDDAARKAMHHSVIFYVFLLVLFVATGLIGYHIGKAAESRNYVRVPSTN